MDKVKKISVISVFLFLIFGFLIAHLLLPDRDISTAERKKLAQLPSISADAVFSGNYFQDLETYLLDQFPLRAQFLDAKRILDKNIFLMSSSSGYASVEDHLTKLTPTLDAEQVTYAVKLLNNFLTSHPEIASAYCAVVPDKNYYLTQTTGQPSMDYHALFEMVKELQAQQISLTELLTLDDYYRTDSHWRQERILPVVQTICEAMGVPYGDPDSYTATVLEGFKGVYYELTETPPEPDTLTYLRNEAIDNATVKRLNQAMKMEECLMYEEAALHDERRYGYDFFLEGPAPLITIENPKAKTDRELIVLCDSFGSSFAPLMADSYSKITLLDLRYVKTYALNNLDIQFADADVLILYSTTIFNTARTAGIG